MPISLGGLASGIDTGSLVDSLVSVARQPVNQLESRRKLLDSASQTVSSLSTKLAALKTAALALSTTDGFSSFSASSSDGAVVATTSGSATVGSFDIEVTKLAKAQKTRSASFALPTTAPGAAGSLDIKVGTADAVPVAILATDTLAEIAAKISSSGARVTAAVVNDGTGSRLLIQGLDTGAENAFTLVENGVSLGVNDVDATYIDAQDAELTIDGLPVKSKTNQLTGAIPGVKLALTKETTGPVNVQVTSDATALKAKVTTFINAYNDFVNTGHSAAGFAGIKAQNSVLSADSSVRGALHKIGGSFSKAIAGTSGAYTTMASIGLVVSREGTLSLNATKFDAAMTSSADSVRRLFVTDTSSGATGLMKTLMGAVDGLVTGAGSPLQARIDSLTAQSKRLAASKIKMETRLEAYEAQLKKQFTAMDQLISKYKTQGSALNAGIPSNSNGSDDS